jgi:hypothetical protein
MTVKIDTDAVINNVVFSDQGSAPATPSANKTRVFTMANGLYIINDDGNVIGPFITGTVDVVARYNSNAAQTIVSNVTGTVVDFEDQVIDTHSAVTTGVNWVFTCPAGQTGYYHVNSRIQFVGTTAWADIERGTLSIHKNGTLYSTLDRRDCMSSASNVQMSLCGSDIIYLLSGETIDIRVSQNSGGNLDIQGSVPEHKYVSIAKIKG